MKGENCELYRLSDRTMAYSRISVNKILSLQSTNALDFCCGLCCSYIFLGPYLDMHLHSCGYRCYPASAFS